MSIASCDRCGDQIDSDIDAECFVDPYLVKCESCREREAIQAESGVAHLVS